MEELTWHNSTVLQKGNILSGFSANLAFEAQRATQSIVRILKETSAKVSFSEPEARVAVALRATVESESGSPGLRRTECDGYPKALSQRSLSGLLLIFIVIFIGDPGRCPGLNWLAPLGLQ